MAIAGRNRAAANRFLHEAEAERAARFARYAARQTVEGNDGRTVGVTQVVSLRLDHALMERVLLAGKSLGLRTQSEVLRELVVSGLERLEEQRSGD